MKRLLLVSGCFATLLVFGRSATLRLTTPLMPAFATSPSGSVPQFSQNSSVVMPSPSQPWIKPRSGWLYVLDVKGGNGPNGQILLVDPQAQVIANRIATGYHPEMALSPDGTRLYLVTAHDLSVFDVVSGQVSQTLPLENRWSYTISPDFPTVAISADGRWLYVYKMYARGGPQNTKYTVATFDTMNGAFLKTETEVGCESALLLPSSAGENLQVICPSENDRTPALIRFLHLTSEPATSTVLALPNGKVPNTQITPALQGGGIGLWNVRTGTLSPDESTLTIFKGDGTALEIDVATRTQKRALTEVYMTDRWVPSRPAVYSHDGTRVYVAIGRLATRTTGQAEEIFVFDARTGRQITTIKTSIPFESLAISNDDRYLYAPSPDRSNPPAILGRIIVIDTSNYREINTMQGIGMLPVSLLVAR